MRNQRHNVSASGAGKTRIIVCKACTADCRMLQNHETGEISGNRCPRGAAFAKTYHPDAVKHRVYQVSVENGIMQRMAVRTGSPVDEALALRIESALKPRVVKAPVEAGEKVIVDLDGSGVDLIAIRKMPARRSPRHTD